MIIYEGLPTPIYTVGPGGGAKNTFERNTAEDPMTHLALTTPCDTGWRLQACKLCCMSAR